MDRFWAWLGAALFALLSSDPLVQGTAANTELFMLCPFILSLIAFLAAAAKTKPHVLFMALAGALTGTAVMFKQVAVVNWFLLVALYPVFAPREKRWRGTVSFIACSATGLLTVLALVVFYFWRRGGLTGFIDNVFTHNLEYIHSIRASERLEYCWGALTTLARTQAVAWALAAAGLAVLFRGPAKWFVFVAGWLLTSGIGVSASGSCFRTISSSFFPLCAGRCRRSWMVCLRSSLEIFASSGPAAALILVLAVLPGITLWPFLFSSTPRNAVRKIYPGNFFAEMPEFARRIESLTPPEKPVFIFGAEPELLFYARRPSATRYIFLFPLYGRYGNAREKQLAAAAEIERANPPTAVYFPNALFFISGTDQYSTGLDSLLHRTEFLH